MGVNPAPGPSPYKKRPTDEGVRMGCRIRCAGWLWLAWVVAMPVHADDLSWRAASVQGPRLPGLNTRLGVALFEPGGPATFERRIVPAGAPQDGRLAIDVEVNYRFPDGSTLLMRSRETIHLTPQGTHGRDEWTGEGEVVSGTGRFAGRSGRFGFRALMGLDAQADGLLGDGFLQGRATLGPAP